MAHNFDESTKEAVNNHYRPRFTGYYIEGNWYCDCPLKAQCRTATKGRRRGQIFWICPQGRGNPGQCTFSVWEDDAEEAILYLGLYGAPAPPILEAAISALQKSAPKTPVKPKLGNAVNPWTKSKRKPLLRDTSSRSRSDEGEGRAGETVAAEREGSEDEDKDDSDPPPPKRTRHSSTTPSGAPVKKAQATISTPTGSPSRRVRFYSSSLGGKSLIERLEECRPSQLDHEKGTLPTPETGDRAVEGPILQQVEEEDKGNGRETFPPGKLHSPINLDDSDTDSDDGLSTPIRKYETNGRSKSIGKGKLKARERPRDLTSAIMDILRSEGHVLKESTRLMIAHEVEVAMDVTDAKIKGGKRTIQKLAGRLDKMENTLALFDEVVELSD